MEERFKGLLYADDLVVFGGSVGKLTKDLRRILAWGDRNGMKLNGKKCGIQFLNGKLDSNLVGREVKLRQDIAIPFVISYRYLGVDICASEETFKAGLLEEMADSRNKKAQGAAGKYHDFLVSRVHHPLIKFRIIGACIAPTAEYMSEIWGGSMIRAEKAGCYIASSIRKVFNISEQCLKPFEVYALAGILDPVVATRMRYINFYWALSQKGEKFCIDQLRQKTVSNHFFFERYRRSYEMFDKTYGIAS